jgi:CDP-glycerol glycerophosphotransferase (TagB/SpsB family)
MAKELGLPPERPYIFYGMVAPYSCPNELDILRWLVEQVNKQAFIKRCSLVIRPHPQTISGIYARDSEELEKLKSLIGPNVALDMPPVLSERLAWDLPKSDMYHLANLISGSAMCLNANSTLCLDACVLDKPVVNVAFDGFEELMYEKSARRGVDYIHMAKLLALGGIRVARNFDELEKHINVYFENPRLDHEGRMQSATQECGPQDGRASKRIVEVLRNLV